MSILTTYANAFPMKLMGMAQSTASVAVSGLIDSTGWEVCACVGCDFVETQFVKNGGTWWQNDKKSFIRAKVVAADTITFSLLKNGTQVAVLNNNSYGTFYNFGDLLNADYKGIVIDWDLVQQGFGYGLYTVKTVHVSLGQTYTFESHKFNVVEYEAGRADGTVRIETYQSGHIMSGFDYSGLGWYQSLRIKGMFGDKTPSLEVDNYEDLNRYVRQISTKVDNAYTLSTQLLPDYISDWLNEDGILANDIYVTDYNLLNQKLYRRFNVYVSDIKNVVNHQFNKNSNYVYEFKQKQNNVIKRNIEGDWASLPREGQSTNVVEVKNLVVRFHWDAGEVDITQVTIDANSAGEFTGTSNDGSSGTITISVNGGAYAAFVSPLTLEVGDTIDVKRTVSTGAGYFQIVGTYE